MPRRMAQPAGMMPLFDFDELMRESGGGDPSEGAPGGARHGIADPTPVVAMDGQPGAGEGMADAVEPPKVDPRVAAAEGRLEARRAELDAARERAAAAKEAYDTAVIREQEARVAYLDARGREEAARERYRRLADARDAATASAREAAVALPRLEQGLADAEGDVTSARAELQRMQEAAAAAEGSSRTFAERRVERARLWLEACERARDTAAQELGDARELAAQVPDDDQGEVEAAQGELDERQQEAMGLHHELEARKGESDRAKVTMELTAEGVRQAERRLARAEEALERAKSEPDAQQPAQGRDDTGHTIRDFGEKIGGARKDQWAGRTLEGGDLAGMDANDLKAFATKEEVWPKPDYEAMVKDGAEKPAVWWVKKVRDSLPTKPSVFYRYKRTDYEAALEKDTLDLETARLSCEAYVAMVATVRDAAMTARDRESLVAAIGALTEADPFGYEVRLRGEGKLSELDPYWNNKRFHDMMHRACVTMRCHDVTYGALERDAEIQGFLLDKEARESQALERRIMVLKVESVTEPDDTGRYYVNLEGGVSQERREGWGARAREDFVPGTWVAYQRDERGNFRGPSVLGCATREEAHDRAMELLRSEPMRARKGRYKEAYLSECVRSGAPEVRDGHVTGEQLMERYGLRAGEFGNWVMDSERQESLDHCYDALHDLALALGIEDSSIGLSGELAIAFGARGNGGAAAAHYEPGRRVINLTKMSGAGSLAHEWLHALDDISARQAGAGTLEAKWSTKAARPGLAAWRDIDRAMRRAPSNGGFYQPSQFLRDAQLMDKSWAKMGNGYWASECEMFARAGAKWVMKVLGDAGVRDDYLCAHADGTCLCSDGHSGTTTVHLAPQGRELEAFGAGLTRMMDDLAAIGMVTKVAEDHGLERLRRAEPEQGHEPQREQAGPGADGRDL